MTSPVLLSLPFAGRWSVQNSPARRVPSHGVDVLGQRYAIDFVGVDDRGRTATVRDWRTVLATEPPERFVAFGRAILAPVDGVVVLVHDGEPDHEGRRSPLALVPYALGQAGRLRQGVGSVAGNHLVLADRASDGFVALAHLRRGSMNVDAGDVVTAGQQIAECGSSGNSTQPHVHVQVMDSPDLAIARGVPLVFGDYREQTRGGRGFVVRRTGIPGDGAVVEAIPGR